LPLLPSQRPAVEAAAGVLGRLTNDAPVLSQVARAALELMHYDNIDTAMTEAAADALTEVPDARCVAGCYRCLLSYYNQPDHELIDRTEREVRAIMLRLARGRVAATARPDDNEANGDWHAALARWGLPAPDGSPLMAEGMNLPLAWRTRLAAAAIGSVDERVRKAAEALGFAIVVLPESPGDAPPSQLVDLLGQSA
jgi:hypothetical protein